MFRTLNHSVGVMNLSVGAPYAKTFMILGFLARTRLWDTSIVTCPIEHVEWHADITLTRHWLCLLLSSSKSQTSKKNNLHLMINWSCWWLPYQCLKSMLIPKPVTFHKDKEVPHDFPFVSCWVLNVLYCQSFLPSHQNPLLWETTLRESIPRLF